MNPKRVVTGSKGWIESSIPGLKFQGQGWYNDGCVLVLDFGTENYQAFLYDADPRPLFREILGLPIHATTHSA
jgi:hypothetical protein